MLGEREPPKKKEKKKKKKVEETEEVEDEESEEEGEDPALDSLSQAIAFQQARIEEDEQRCKQREDANGASTSEDSRRPRIKKSAYFSDDEELSD
ncbi:zinc finger CCHC-type and RNA-binding motif-containing protein 1-like [Acipenser ruthenus]|nr:zinc finger CCHC-type and RNA-binding motif-containing protein 1-like [Acipenser ruthenus]XP_033881123.3 zinc finger CCHC-type and RNA-binding motif-containing protein 1-like [Acipenser ruthenus]XP_058883482.1 zinc finger CCHC-type and RNA-binding motif-containing protein 1-like [Acipenser ruthenus]XP_058883483.1 zinc finger CCHC-type and RNA-binding motif-containing protein 1-like [Acipenser ruthenus]XP_058883484.1 zinc finger CCHC-type and RNA-binding motif-containing protein 1-like [Acipe